MAGKLVIGRCRFDRQRCESLLDALRNWRRKYDEGRQNYGELVHDWSSHGAAAFTYMALSDDEIVAPAPRNPLSIELEDGVRQAEDMPFHYGD